MASFTDGWGEPPAEVGFGPETFGLNREAGPVVPGCPNSLVSPTPPATLPPTTATASATAWALRSTRRRERRAATRSSTPSTSTGRPSPRSSVRIRSSTFGMLDLRALLIVLTQRRGQRTAGPVQGALGRPFGDPERGRHLRHLHVEVVPEHRHLPLPSGQLSKGPGQVRPALHRLRTRPLRRPGKPGPALHPKPPEPVPEQVPRGHRHPRRQRLDVTPPLAELPGPSQRLLHRVLRRREAPAHQGHGVHQPRIVRGQELADPCLVQ